MSRPKLLVVDLDAVMSELDSLRSEWIDRDLQRVRAYIDAGGTYNATEMDAQAAVRWAETFPALELLRDETR